MDACTHIVILEGPPRFYQQLFGTKNKKKENLEY